MSTFGSAVVWCSIQVTLASAVGAVVYLMARRAGPVLRARIVMATLVVVLVLSGFAISPWPRWSPLFETTDVPTSDEAIGFAGVPVSAESGGGESSVDVSATLTVPNEPNAARTTALDSSRSAEVGLASLLAEWRDAVRALDGTNVVPEQEQGPRAWTWIEVCGVAFVASALIAFLQLGVGCASVVRLRRRSRPLTAPELVSMVNQLCVEMGLSRQVVLRVSSDIGTPATMGVWRPVILLPTDWESWSESERATVFAHELTHIQRSDFVARLVAQFGLALHFYHPLVHWLVGRLRLEQELAADTGAARVAGGQRRYLSTLAEMALQLQDRVHSSRASQSFLHTFLPSRDSFIRRIEMLRAAETWTANPSRTLRTSCLAVVLLAGLGAVGLRGVNPDGIVNADEPTIEKKATAAGNLLTVQQTDVAVAKQGTAKKGHSKLSLAFVPSDSIMVWAIRPKEILGLKGFESLEQVLREEDRAIADLDQMLQVVGVKKRPGGPHEVIGTIFHSSQPNDFRDKAFGLRADGTAGTHKGMKYRTTEGRQSFHIANGRTLVVSSTEENLKRMLDAASGPDAAWSSVWSKVSADHAAMAVNLLPIREELSKQLDRGPTAMMGMFRPLWEQGDAIVGGARLDEQLTAQVSFLTPNANNANTVKATLEAAIQLGRNMMVGVRANLEQADGPNAGPGIKPARITADLSDQLLKNVKVSLDDNLVVVKSALEGSVTKHMALLAPEILRARSRARQMQSMNNLKQIGLAMHNYAAANGRFPAAVLKGKNGDGKHSHSWRVAILPYLGEKALYDAYNFDEPWDSEHNQEVTAKMPAAYRHPTQPKDSTDSGYFVFTGNTTAFRTTGDGVRFRDMIDGTSNSLLAVEAKRKIHWAKPQDIPFAPSEDVPELGGFDEAGFNTVFCDGAARFLKQSIDEDVLKRLIQIADRQVVKPSDFD